MEKDIHKNTEKSGKESLNNNNKNNNNINLNQNKNKNQNNFQYNYSENETIDMKKIFLIAIIIIAVITLLFLAIRWIFTPKEEIDPTYSKAVVDQYEKTIEDLMEADEQTRIERYFRNFLDNIQSGEYDIEYDKLYDDFKLIHFKTQNEFEEYLKENMYLPGTNQTKLANEIKNFEKIGDLYILTVDILKSDDVLQSLYDMKFIFEEQAINNYRFSFSVHTAKDNFNDFAEEVEEIDLDTNRDNTSDTPAFDLMEKLREQEQEQNIIE